MSETGNGDKVVVLAVDASIHAERAFNYYCEHLHKNNHKVVLVHSAEYPRAPAGQIMAADVWEMEIAKKEQEIKTMEEYYKDRLKALNVEGITRFVYHSKAGETVVHVAQEEKADLVVVGRRGAGAFRRTIIGSTSDYLIHHLNCAVLVCPPPPKGHDKSNYDHDDEHEHGEHHHHHHKSLFSRFLPHHRHHSDSKDGKEHKEQH